MLTDAWSRSTFPDVVPLQIRSRQVLIEEDVIQAPVF
jgi:hypothetical protein